MSGKTGGDRDPRHACGSGQAWARVQLAVAGWCGEHDGSSR
jgi:hypothetical protein